MKGNKFTLSFLENVQYNSEYSKLNVEIFSNAIFEQLHMYFLEFEKFQTNLLKVVVCFML